MGSQGTIDLGADEPAADGLRPAELEEVAVETTEEEVKHLDAGIQRRITRLLRDANRTQVVMMLLVEVCPHCHCADYYDIVSRDGQAKRKCVSCNWVYLPAEGDPVVVVAHEDAAAS